MDERRLSTRKLMSSALKIYSEDGCRTIGYGQIVNLSEGGMRMISDNKLGVGEKFSLHFRIPHSWNLDFIGDVVHKEAAIECIAYGIKFQEGQDTFILQLL